MKEKNIPPVDVANYPAIKAHLDQFYPQLAKRQDKGDTPYNLRNCAYMEDFNKQKIVWKRVGSILKFALDKEGLICLDSTCFAVGNYLPFITCYLNSKIGNYLLQGSPRTGTGDLLISVQAVEPLPIIKPDNISRYEDFIEDINLGHNIDDLINKQIFNIYGMDKDEVSFLTSISSF